MARRFFADKSAVCGKELILTGNEHFHISKVLRMKVSDEIQVSSNEGIEYNCKIEKITKDCTSCVILGKNKILEKLPNITVFVAVMKGEHMDFCIQKLTELGIKKVVPFLSQFVVVKGDKTERFERISLEACKQSGRKIPMEISKILTFDEVLENLKSFPQIVLAYEGATQPLKDVLRSFDKNKETAILIGSEGGFSQKEVERLKNIGAKVVTLGKNILRGETATVTLASILLYEFDQFKV